MAFLLRSRTFKLRTKYLKTLQTSTTNIVFSSKRNFCKYESSTFDTVRNVTALLKHNDINKCVFGTTFLLTRGMSSRTNKFKDENSSEEEEEEDDLNDEDHREISANAYRLIPGMGHSVLLLLPKIKWGSKRNYKTTPELQIAESETLVGTLENWTVVRKEIINCLSQDKKYLFGTGNMEKVKQLASDPEISAVFISQNKLTGLQQAALEDLFQKPVYDRYTIVLRIFLEHARSREAKLQVALAEIPYLKSRLRINVNARNRNESRSKAGSGETYLEIHRRLLFEREQKLKKRIEKLKTNRRILRENPHRKSFPSVAVIGYTNSGKTSLIKALTEDEKLEPRPQLFATLDVTNHLGYLPCKQAALFVDTVGFITDIPTDLLQAFIATLDDISKADLIIHIWDASHPDIVNQRETVLKTLEALSLPPRLTGSLLHVGNKIDLLKEPVNVEDGELLISATEGTGMNDLWLEIEKRLIQTTGMLFQTVRVPNGGQEMSWLEQWTTVQELIVDPEDPNFVILNVICSYAVRNKFHHYFKIKMENKN